MFAKVENGVAVACPYTWDDMRRDNPETLFPDEYVESVFMAYGAVEVFLVDRPEANSDQIVIKKMPEFINGVLTQVWEVVPKASN